MSDLPELKTVPAVDLARYMGTWYEIARLPMRHEPREATDISATYALQEDGSVEVCNRMRLDGEVDEAVGRATANDARGSRLEVTFLPEGGDGSPDRVDALVWALTELSAGREYRFDI